MPGQRCSEQFQKAVRVVLSAKQEPRPRAGVSSSKMCTPRKLWLLVEVYGRPWSIRGRERILENQVFSACWT